jgi:hypothetical protein
MILEINIYIFLTSAINGDLHAIATSTCRRKRRDFIFHGRVAANILNKQSWTADKGWSSSLGVGHGANNSSP